MGGSCDCSGDCVHRTETRVRLVIRSVQAEIDALEAHREQVLEDAIYERGEVPGFASGRSIGLGEAIDALRTALRAAESDQMATVRVPGSPERPGATERAEEAS